MAELTINAQPRTISTGIDHDGRTIRLMLQEDRDGIWWASSPDVPELIASAPDVIELMQEAHRRLIAIDKELLPKQITLLLEFTDTRLAIRSPDIPGLNLCNPDHDAVMADALPAIRELLRRNGERRV